MGFSKVLWIEKNRVNVLIPIHFTLFILVNKIYKKKNYKSPIIYQFALFFNIKPTFGNKNKQIHNDRNNNWIINNSSIIHLFDP